MNHPQPSTLHPSQGLWSGLRSGYRVIWRRRLAASPIRQLGAGHGGFVLTVLGTLHYGARSVETGGGSRDAVGRTARGSHEAASRSHADAACMHCSRRRRLTRWRQCCPTAHEGLVGPRQRGTRLCHGEPPCGVATFIFTKALCSLLSYPETRNPNPYNLNPTS